MNLGQNCQEFTPCHAQTRGRYMFITIIVFQRRQVPHALSEYSQTPQDKKQSFVPAQNVLNKYLLNKHSSPSDQDFFLQKETHLTKVDECIFKLCKNIDQQNFEQHKNPCLVQSSHLQIRKLRLKEAKLSEVTQLICTRTQPF